MKQLIFLMLALGFMVAAAVADPVDRSANSPPYVTLTLENEISFAPVAEQIAVENPSETHLFACSYQDCVFIAEERKPDFEPCTFSAVTLPESAMNRTAFLPDIRRLTESSSEKLLHKNKLRFDKTIGLIAPIDINSSCKANRCRAV